MPDYENDIPLATAEWLNENCSPFTLPGRVAAQFAASQARQAQQQEPGPAEPDDEHPQDPPETISEDT